MKNNIFIIVALAIVALIVVVSARNALENPVVKTIEPTESVNKGANNFNIQDGYQVVELKYENYQYQLYPNVMKKGVPVKMEVDLNTVTGCMVAVRIPSFNVAKTVSQGDNVITFTPDKAGTFNIACSMGMGRNTFTVVDDNNQASSYVETAPAQTQAAGGSCGAGKGGCGCMGGGKF